VTCENGSRLDAAYIVNASGYEVIHFIGKKMVDFDCTYAIVTEHQSEHEPLWKDRALLWNTDDPYLYLRLTTDNRILAGGRDEPFSTKITRQLYLEKKARLLEKDVQKILPRLDFKTEFAWSGTFGKTKDSLPYIGAMPPNQNILYALGFGGNGITFGQVAAEIIRDKITGKENPDAALFSFNR
jgi:glycine/D-amino acid oxidase-like deaminating enzyme